MEPIIIMGAIKDAVDLIEKLDTSIKNRKILDLLFPIKNKISQAKLSHSEEVSSLNTQISELKSKIDHLEAKVPPGDVAPPWDPLDC
jgi:predicted  nucleic acid-binding Zn-ribbon protein